jgi:hypothetical protein
MNLKGVRAKAAEAIRIGEPATNREISAILEEIWIGMWNFSIPIKG